MANLTRADRPSRVSPSNTDTIPHLYPIVKHLTNERFGGIVRIGRQIGQIGRKSVNRSAPNVKKS
jgi:hypothetical protein